LPLYTGKKICTNSHMQKVEIQLLGARNIPRNIEIDGISFPKGWSTTHRE